MTDDDTLYNLDALELQKYQPNRYPFLFIDHVDEVIPGKYAKGYKNLTYNEWFFPKHFVDKPLMPGVLQVEALAQMMTIVITTLPGNEGKFPEGISYNVRLKKEVVPGDRLVIEATVLSFKRGVCKGKAIGSVNNQIACEVDMTLILPHIFNLYSPSKVLEHQ